MGRKQLTEEKREILERLFMQGRSFREIGRIIGYSHVTISREYKKGTRDNDGRGYYCCRLAQDRTCRRRKVANKQTHSYCEELLQYIRQKLRTYWSPELISGRLRVDFPNDDSMRVSFKTIYRWLNAGTACHRAHPWKGFTPFLRRKRQGKQFGRNCDRQRRVLSNLPCISNRPQIVCNRKRFGDWEADLIRGYRGQGYLVTLVERQSGFVTAAHCKRKNIEDVNKGILKALGSLPAQYIKTITVDRGKEFYGFKELEKTLSTQFYFCHPNSPQERGQNEHVNGLLRQFFPKKMSLANISQQQINEATAYLNNRPKKKFNFRTTMEFIAEKGLLQMVTFA